MDEQRKKTYFILAKTRVISKFGLNVFKKHDPWKGRKGRSGTPIHLSTIQSVIFTTV